MDVTGLVNKEILVPNNHKVHFYFYELFQLFLLIYKNDAASIISSFRCLHASSTSMYGTFDQRILFTASKFQFTVLTLTECIRT